MTSENVAEHEADESSAAVSAKSVGDQLTDELMPGPGTGGRPHG
ncbi:hypothetical protein [Streptomyces sp. SLBN-134]|nr:hypothetical protein [Streptomyces sp. SLBN-134]TQL18164.1 hypothetical protein FBY37_0048 [Streptomyces sp. SLBN-134]